MSGAEVGLPGLQEEIPDRDFGPVELDLLTVRLQLLEEFSLLLLKERGGLELRKIVLVEVLPQYPMHVEPFSDRTDGVLHHLNPPLRDITLVPVVVEFGDLLLQKIVDLVGLHHPLHGLVLVDLTGGDRPTVAAVVPLRPPSIQNAQVESPVDGGLHPRGSARFHRLEGVVEPDVDALHKVLSNVDVIIFHKDQSVLHIVTAGYVENLLDQLLASLVRRMGLPGEDELNRALGVGENLHESLGILENQVGPLVRGETTGKADGQVPGIEEVPDPADLRKSGALLLEFQNFSIPDEGDQLFFPPLVGRPDLGIRSRVDPLPNIAPFSPMEIVGADVPVEEVGHLHAQPSLYMDSVGDVADGNLLLRKVGVDIPPHLPGDLTVDLGDAVDEAGEVHGELR